MTDMRIEIDCDALRRREARLRAGARRGERATRRTRLASPMRR